MPFDPVDDLGGGEEEAVFVSGGHGGFDLLPRTGIETTGMPWARNEQTATVDLLASL